MKAIITTLFILSLCLGNTAFAQQILNGRVVNSESGTPVAGANILLLKARVKFATDAQGRFSIAVPSLPDTVLVTFLGFAARKVTVQNVSVLMEINLLPIARQLDDVVINTGYYQLPRERATGAFSQISNKQINRSVSTNIIDRLEGISIGLSFDRRNIEKENQAGTRPEIRVRGISTIESNSTPLIVLNNFPYEGNLSTINPNDVESITILKDAAAASIWGARAGNGVIVINTKSGRYGEPLSVSVNANINVVARPDLHYNKNWLPSATVMGIERELYEKGAYSINDFTRLPAYVELLISKEDISPADFSRQEQLMQQTDLRNESLKYLYQEAISRQFAINLSGGGTNHKFYLSAGYDRNRANIIGNSDNRLSLNFQNTLKFNKKLELSTAVNYVGLKNFSNGISHNDIGLTYGGTDRYARLLDQNGQALPIGKAGYRLLYQQNAPETGLLDWLYRPLDEQKYTDNTSNTDELRLNTTGRYQITTGLNFQLTYQYIKSQLNSRSLYVKESYYARDLINRYTQPDGRKVIPAGGILDIGSPYRSATHFGRAQVNFNRTLGSDHEFNALAGAEVNQERGQLSPASRLYRYDSELGIGSPVLDYTTYYNLRPQGFGSVPMGDYFNTRTTNRNLSYFGNGSYLLRQRYTFSGSVRWDGSNLLGVKANQRGTLLYSAGASWEISKESFYPAAHWLPYLRLRATYGSAGNIDKTQSHYPVISIGTNSITNLPAAELSSPGNPSLRWEQVNTFNTGMDLTSKNQRITASLDWFRKDARHLLGDNQMDPTSGINGNFKMNYASLLTQGFDLQLQTRNFNGPLFWTSTLLLNYATDRVMEYTAPTQTNASSYWANAPLTLNKSRDLLYALPWAGLNPATGQPQIYIDGEISDDYKKYYDALRVQDLHIAGKTVPPFSGSMLNTFSFRGFELSGLITFKTGFVFRRNSMYPGEEYVTENPLYHSDYFKRWKKPGDEKFTDVPAWTADRSEHRKWLYQYSTALVTKGDVIRLQDVNLSYTFNSDRLKSLNIQSLRIYAYARNLPIIWRANKQGIDPDYPNADYPAPFSCAFGMQLNF